MKRHVEQAQRNGFFINDLSLSSGVEMAFWLQWSCRRRRFRRTGNRVPYFASVPSEKQERTLDRGLVRCILRGAVKSLESNPEVGFDPSNTPHPGPVTREPLALISGLR
jgi:hypothetical protein